MPFQREGIKYATDKSGRCLLADEMGLGKTLQAICIAYYYKSEWPLLIVVPSSMKFIWIEEIEKWLPEIMPHDINLLLNTSDLSDIPHALITIVTYGLVRSSHAHVLIEALFNQNFKVVVLDESHYIKNTKTASCRVLMPLIQQAERRILITGTPALSRPVELYGQLDAILPGQFGSFNTYTKRYCDGHLEWIGRIRKWRTDGASNLDELQQRLSNTLMIRRLKKDVLTQLPPKRRQRIPFELKESKFKKDLDRAWDDLSPVLKNLKMNVVDVLKVDGDGGARQGNNVSEMKGLIFELYRKTCKAKIGPVVEYVKFLLEDPSTKFLVFAHHHEMMDAIQKELILSKIEYIRIDGSTAQSDRARLVHTFQTKKTIRVAILSILAAGVGLTFTAASLVVFAELHWTPGTLIQCEDRAHRIGQTNPVNIHYLVAKGSVDEWVWGAIKKKTVVVSTILNGVCQSLEEVVNQDEDKIFRLTNAEVYKPPDPADELELTQLFDTEEDDLPSTQTQITDFFCRHAKNKQDGNTSQTRIDGLNLLMPRAAKGNRNDVVVIDDDSDGDDFKDVAKKITFVSKKESTKKRGKTITKINQILDSDSSVVSDKTEKTMPQSKVQTVTTKETGLNESVDVPVLNIPCPGFPEESRVTDEECTGNPDWMDYPEGVDCYDYDDVNDGGEIRSDDCGSRSDKEEKADFDQIGLGKADVYSVDSSCDSENVSNVRDSKPRLDCLGENGSEKLEAAAYCSADGVPEGARTESESVVEDSLSDDSDKTPVRKVKSRKSFGLVSGSAWSSVTLDETVIEGISTGAETVGKACEGSSNEKVATTSPLTCEGPNKIENVRVPPERGDVTGKVHKEEDKAGDIRGDKDVSEILHDEETGGVQAEIQRRDEETAENIQDDKVRVSETEVETDSETDALSVGSSDHVLGGHRPGVVSETDMDIDSDEQEKNDVLVQETCVSNVSNVSLRLEVTASDNEMDSTVLSQRGDDIMGIVSRIETNNKTSLHLESVETPGRGLSMCGQFEPKRTLGESSRRAFSSPSSDEQLPLQMLNRIDKWACHICTFVNHADLPYCEICETKRMKPVPSTMPRKREKRKVRRRSSHVVSVTKFDPNLDDSDDEFTTCLSIQTKSYHKASSGQSLKETEEEGVGTSGTGLILDPDLVNIGQRGQASAYRSSTKRPKVRKGNFACRSRSVEVDSDLSDMSKDEHSMQIDDSYSDCGDDAVLDVDGACGDADISYDDDLLELSTNQSSQVCLNTADVKNDAFVASDIEMQSLTNTAVSDAISEPRIRNTDSSVDKFVTRNQVVRNSPGACNFASPKVEIISGAIDALPAHSDSNNEGLLAREIKAAVKLFSPKSSFRSAKKVLGDWTCNKCGHNNDVSDDDCDECFCPKPVKNLSPLEDSLVRPGVGCKSEQKSNGREKVVTGWKCLECDFQNRADDVTCFVCSNRKPAINTSSDTKLTSWGSPMLKEENPCPCPTEHIMKTGPSNPENQSGDVDEMFNDLDAIFCRTLDPTQATWTCLQCGHDNLEEDDLCDECFLKRGEKPPQGSKLRLVDKLCKKCDERRKREDENRVINLDEITVHETFLFCCSKNTSRVFVYDKNVNALNINFIPMDVETNNLDDIPDLLLHPAHFKIIKTFVKEWNSLSMTKKRVCLRQGMLFKSPLAFYEEVKGKKVSKSNQRYQTKVDVAVEAMAKADEVQGSLRIIERPKLTVAEAKVKFDATVKRLHEVAKSKQRAAQKTPRKRKTPQKTASVGKKRGSAGKDTPSSRSGKKKKAGSHVTPSKQETVTPTAGVDGVKRNLGDFQGSDVTGVGHGASTRQIMVSEEAGRGKTMLQISTAELQNVKEPGRSLVTIASVSSTSKRKVTNEAAAGTDQDQPSKKRRTENNVGNEAGPSLDLSRLPIDVNGKVIFSEADQGVVQAVNQDGTPLCLHCHTPVTNQSLSETTVKSTDAAWELRLCSRQCKEQYWLKTNRQYGRHHVFELEHGVCQLCNFDAGNFFQQIKAMKDYASRASLIKDSPFSSLSADIKQRMVKDPKQGMFWHVDHITAVADGGGQCDIDNLRTLCYLCHKVVTKQQNRERAIERRVKHVGKCADLTKFFQLKME
ncbi:uncharacterized protein LOC135484357 [Lineus longissimus]|uniref:uncharacterized protein LOC135484357 n=1 Tax=Lineus longissimus TaxID=88925 RepID=UPI00315D1FAF